MTEASTFATPSHFEVQEIVPVSVASFEKIPHASIENIARNKGDELWHRNEYRIDERLQEIDDLVRREELRYAKFMARRNSIISAVSDYEYKQLVSSVSLRLVYYDPNFDFQSDTDPLWDHLNRLTDPCNFSKPTRLEVRHLQQPKGL